jgi:uncharacterized protein (TIGR03118 family)
MLFNFNFTNQWPAGAARLLAITLLGAAALSIPTPRSMAQSASSKQQGPQPDIIVISPGSAYRQANLISDLPGFAFVQDPLLVNPWGIAASTTSPFWLTNNGSSSSTLYSGGAGGSPVAKNSLLVTVQGGLPTGSVFNSTSDFSFTPPGGSAGAARFLFASITGNITAWQSTSGTLATIQASHPGHVYTGLAIGNNGSANFLYAADFANGTIDVFDANFALQSSSNFPFADPTIPTTSGNTFYPFNIQNIGGSLYVTYAKLGTDGRDEEGVGNGFVRRFDTNGVRDLTFGINNGALNSPWGITIAPASFGVFGGALLVGNFGEGNPSIHAYNSTTGAFLGTLQDEGGLGIEIDELWALTFGNGVNGGDVNTLYFTAGTAEEEHGLFGSLNPTTSSATSLIQFGSSDLTIGEGGHVDVTVNRSGDVSGTATVDFATIDESQVDHASQKADYQIAVGKLTFGPGETSKTFRVLITEDTFDEGDETLEIGLTNITGSGAGLSGSPLVLTITDNDSGAPTTNAIDDNAVFVRQQFLDLLNREPTTAELDDRVDQLSSCGSDNLCREQKRADISQALFTSEEFFENGTVVSLAYRAAFGRNVFYGEFMKDNHALGAGFIDGAPGSAALLEANKVAFFNDFVRRPQFVADFAATLSPDAFVDLLFAHAGFTPSAGERQAVIAEFGGASDTSDLVDRAQAVRRVTDNVTFIAQEFNRSFVLWEYFGYFRRDPNTVGFNFWVARLDTFGGDFEKAEMIKHFISHIEYRQRFGLSTPAQSLNSSARAKIGTGDNVLIGGFIILGGGSHNVLVRGLGPSLTQAGVIGALADPFLELHGPGGLIATNNNWKDTQQVAIQATGLAPQSDAESAILAPLTAGTYTIVEKGNGGGTGTGLAEIYILDSGVANFSARALVQTGDDVLIEGFIVGPSSSHSTNVVVRALGPSLSASGVSNPLADPRLGLFNANGDLVASNNDWRDTQESDIQNTGFEPGNDLEPAITIGLPPGAYTAVVSGNGGGTGTALVEFYNLDSRSVLRPYPRFSISGQIRLGLR